MFHRQIKLPDKYSFFLFGARATGKTTLLTSLYQPENTLFIDLLDLNEELRFIRDPERLSRIIDELPPDYNRIIIDEIQRVPSLLDVVHRKIEQRNREEKPLQFIMTGSSARKLKRGAANLLAGRAFVYHLFPLTTRELGDQFDLQECLEYGSLPNITNIDVPSLKLRYLESYAQTYLKEEIWNEQIIRKLAPFSNFLDIAAQMNGKILNYSKIARDIHVDTKTVQSYYQILEDTLLGFSVLPFHRSVRKRQTMLPKFYFFDTGIKRALDHTLTVPLLSQTYAYGEAFEHWILIEMIRANQYYKRDYNFYYFKTHDGAEIDIIIERPGKAYALVEVKSSPRFDLTMIKHLTTLAKDIVPADCYLLSQDKTPQKIGSVTALHWLDGLKELSLF